LRSAHSASLAAAPCETARRQASARILIGGPMIS
jgi:hypothetical protein